jgi:hypothetical protein
MENIFYVSKRGDFDNGVFGTLYDCASWILKQEGVEGTPDVNDPLESLNELLKFNSEVKYDLEAAENAIPRMLSIDEALRLQALPKDIRVSDVPEWLVDHAHDNVIIKQMVDLLHGRILRTRWRGSMHAVGNSPFTAEVYSALLKQLS